LRSPKSKREWKPSQTEAKVRVFPFLRSFLTVLAGVEGTAGWPKRFGQPSKFPRSIFGKLKIPIAAKTDDPCH
jgi:hypothetical protein